MFLLLLNIFVAGFVVIALEILGIRILASVFGYSIFVWGTIIGIILVALSIGYYGGGLVADRSSSFATIYKVILAGTFYLAITIMSYPFLLGYLAKWDQVLGISLGSIILLVPPAVLLSMVSPIAIKALLREKQEGKIIGGIYSLSNAGSILGVFITTFILIPELGSKGTLLLCFGGTLGFALLGLLLEKPARKVILGFFVAGIVLMLGGFVIAEPVKQRTVLKTESVYNSIEIADSLGTRYLLLNGHPMSYKDLGEVKLEHYFYDAMAVLPEMLGKRDMLVLGFGSGTVWEKIDAFFPGVYVEGVEIDGKVVEIGREYFGLRESEKLKVHVDDARHFVQNAEREYSIVFNNAINAKFIPFHLVTREFFGMCSEKLAEDGVMVNYSFYTEGETVLRDSIARTMCEVFPSVYYLDFPMQNVSLLYGFKQETGKNEIAELVSRAVRGNENENAIALFEYHLNMEEFNCSAGEIITDDKNPIDLITLKQIT
jgi:spermidine synthase